MVAQGKVRKGVCKAVCLKRGEDRGDLCLSVSPEPTHYASHRSHHLGKTTFSSSLVRKSKLASFALFLTPSQLVEQVLIERFILVLGAGGQENVTTYVFMHDLAICTQAGERNGDILVKLNCHLEEKAQVNLTSD